MKPISEQRRRRQRGNSSIEFAMSFAFLWGLVSGVYSIGHSLYAYNQLTIAVSNAARFAGRDGMVPSKEVYRSRIKNVAVYGNPEGTGESVITGLRTSNIDVEIQEDSAGVPLSVTVEISSFQIDGAFWRPTLINKPFATTRYAGRYQPYAT